MGNKKKERSKARKEGKKMVASQEQLIQASLQAPNQSILEGIEAAMCNISWNDANTTSNTNASDHDDVKQSTIELIYHSKQSLPSEWKVRS